jgi:hypothetical protein
MAVRPNPIHLARTPGGRKATYHAYQHLGVSPPTKPGQVGLDL